MDVRAQIGDIRMLRRIVALLFALADVAESVADRSVPVRWLVLTILRWAEPVARDFVARETGVVLPEHEDMSPGGNGPADALLLAAQFRVMAVALDALMSLEYLFGRDARQHRTVRPDAIRPFSRGSRRYALRHVARDPPLLREGPRRAARRHLTGRVPGIFRAFLPDWPRGELAARGAGRCPRVAVRL